MQAAAHPVDLPLAGPERFAGQDPKSHEPLASHSLGDTGLLGRNFYWTLVILTTIGGDLGLLWW